MLVIDQLIAEINRKSSPIVVGLDPEVEHIPAPIKDEMVRQFGPTTRAAAEAIYHFNAALLDEIHLLIPAVKLQMACYELYEAEGLSGGYECKIAKQINETNLTEYSKKELVHHF